MKFVLVILLHHVLSKRCDADLGEKIRDRGISQAKQAQIIQLHNDYRNEIATGKKHNWNKQILTAADMNYLKYSHQLAQLAQDCLDKCPSSKIGTECNLNSNQGFLFYAGDTMEGGADWALPQMFRSWVLKPESARQLELAGVKHFGCGRTQVSRKNIPSETFLCIYDRKALMHGDVYAPGPPAGKCQFGRKQGFVGLCKHSNNEFNVLKKSKKHHHKK